MAKESTRVRRRERKNITSGVAHVSATFNNTMITITDAQGNAISWSSAGTMGFKGFIVAHTMYQDEARQIQEAGADEAYLTMSETGVALASHLMDRTPAKPSLIVGKSV